MSFKNPILQEYAEQIARDYEIMLENGVKGYDAIFKLAEENQMSRFQIYRYIKHAGTPIKKDRTKPPKTQ
jgi:DNA-binding phage protein